MPRWMLTGAAAGGVAAIAGLAFAGGGWDADLPEAIALNDRVAISAEQQPAAHVVPALVLSAGDSTDDSPFDDDSGGAAPALADLDSPDDSHVTPAATAGGGDDSPDSDDSDDSPDDSPFTAPAPGVGGDDSPDDSPVTAPPPTGGGYDSPDDSASFDSPDDS